MLRRLLWNDIRNHKLLSLSTVIFMASSSLFISLVAVLFVSLLGSVDGLMERAVTPDYLQMHTGAIQTEKIRAFAEDHPEIEKWQVCSFLNLDNSSLMLGNKSLADSTQDNGLCVQSEDFDYLLDMDNVCPMVKEGEVYVPVCYRSVYDLNIGDKMQIGNEELVVVGFIRDSQMSSMMASSKRFLVSQTDYERIKKLGEEEYLIEFLLKKNADTDSFAADYGSAGLYANGPAITKPLIRMMNALSDGIMILVILLVGIGVLLISLLCIRFITALGVEKDRKEVGMLKALGIAEIPQNLCSTISAPEFVTYMGIGDAMELGNKGKRRSFVVCGIYSDITNGGKTAKVKSLSFNGNADDQVIWSNIYISLKDDVLAKQWMEEYKQYGVDVVNIADYVQGTYGPTIRQIERARLVAMGIAILIVMVVVMLFMRLLIEKKRYCISLQKALGFNHISIRTTYFRQESIPITVGVLAGLLFGNILGESICGQILKSFGAFGFRFVLVREKWWRSWVLQALGSPRYYTIYPVWISRPVVRCG